MYALSPEIINIYFVGIEKIFSGEQKGEPYFHMVENGSVVKFTTGGIVYQKDRMN